MDPVVWPLRQKLSGVACPTGDGIYRINNLPDDNILHILSFLPTRDAIRTSILSRRWKYLWTSMSDIELDDDIRGRRCFSSIDFLKFVDGVLRQHDSSDITRLVLIVRYTFVYSFCIHSWISSAITHNIQHLNLSVSGSIIHSLPCSLFTCQSLRFLSLDFHVALQTPTSVHLPHLKTLWLWRVEFVDDKSAESLFSGCPVLEELQLWDCEWKNIGKDIKIAIPNLKKLDIRHDIPMDRYRRGVINIYASNLISLTYYTNFKVEVYLHDLCSLVDASIQGIGPLNYRKNARRFLNVVASAYNVKSLAISEHSLMALGVVEELADRLPTFHNLTNCTLSLGFDGWAISCRGLMDLLEKVPNLKCIHFDGGFESPDNQFEDEQHIFERAPTCVENSLEKVVVSSFTGQRKELYIMRCFLINAKKLEKITLYFHDPSDKKRLEQKLKKTLPKGPGKCLIELLLKRFVPDTAS